MKKNLILFGAGNYGREAYKELSTDYNIKCFADNGATLAGTLLQGIEIVLGNEVLEYMDTETDIVITISDFWEIEKQLKNYGIKEYYIYTVNGIYHKDNDCESKIVRCNRCIMDSKSDKTILFNEKGECSYCTEAIKNINKMYFPNVKGKEKLDELLNEVKEYGKDKKYDCLMGISGGLDSSYLAYLGNKWGLRILAVHIDDGYDTDISKSNLNKLIEKTGIDCRYIVPDKEQYSNLILAYMKAGVPNIAVPQDNILNAFLYKTAKENGIKYFFSGNNFALECITQRGNSYRYQDETNIRNIFKRFGTGSLDKLEFITEKQIEEYRDSLDLKTVYPLNYIDYNRERAFTELKEFCGFEYYGRKHLENILTAFIQLRWFPEKFGVDKRTSHLSSMIVSNQISRQDAIKELEEPLYDKEQMEKYIETICKNLKLSQEQFEELMDAPVHNHEEYND